MEEKREIYNINRKCYRAVIKDDWKKVKEEITGKEEAAGNFRIPMTSYNDMALHLAAHSRMEEPTKTLLSLAKKLGMEESIAIEKDFWKNVGGNTPLHEAATAGNLEAVKLLVEYKIDDMLVKNIYGETPLFRAAKYGQLKIVEYFLDNCEDTYIRTPLNWTADNLYPIIHATILSGECEVVNKLIEFDGSLLEMKDRDRKTALHVLANMPSAFRSGCPMKLLENVIYDVLPSEDIYKYNFSNLGSSNNENGSESSIIKNKNEDLEAGNNSKPPQKIWHWSWVYFARFLRCYFWKFVFSGWTQWKDLYDKKQRHILALTITKKLAHIDIIWCQTPTPENTDVDFIGIPHLRDGGTVEDDYQYFNILNNTEPSFGNKRPKIEEDEIKYYDYHETPLLLAAANGILEIIEAIVEVYPQAIDYVTVFQRNVLHVAIAHRQLEVFKWIQKHRLIMSRLVTRIDVFGFTALHHVGVMNFYRGGIHGPALQLQQELKWYERVKSQIPALYNMHHNNMKCTPRQYFDHKHEEMLGEAKEWIKKTSESCSAVAALIATVVFAAAYTVPGGLNSKTGSPVLLTESIYIVFTVMDIVALANSLTSMVLFLSILTSSFKMEAFLHTLPIKLSLGFQLLFFSVATMMMAFALTVVLTIKSEEMKWTVSLLYVATFFPVSMFIIIQLPLYVELVKSIWSYRDNIFKFLPMGFLVRFWKLLSKISIKKFV